jgi:hypothetical protein
MTDDEVISVEDAASVSRSRGRIRRPAYACRTPLRQATRRGMRVPVRSSAPE